MVATDVIEREGASCFLGVLATDLCAQALQQARAGRFRAKRLEQIPEGLRRRFFSAENAQFYQAQPALKRRMCFAQTNLLDIAHLPTLPMDIIFCQNVLVYFRRWRSKLVLDALVERLKPGGLLVLGPGEAAHWQHPALVRMSHQGVTAWLRRIDAQSSTQEKSHKNSLNSADFGSTHKVEQHGR
jgi:chemotaxis protein methyltransferase CheR/type IV pilus assembly protein PilK